MEQGGEEQDRRAVEALSQAALLLSQLVRTVQQKELQSTTATPARFSTAINARATGSRARGTDVARWPSLHTRHPLRKATSDCEGLLHKSATHGSCPALGSGLLASPPCKEFIDAACPRNDG